MEIVARAYDQDKKKIIVNIVKPEHGGFFHSIGGYLLDPRFVVDQWTGEVDKDGTQIFTNDIIEIESETALAIGNTRVRALIGFKDGCFMYSSGADKDKMNALIHPIASKCKVIGNKFENEPLLWVQAKIKKPRKKYVRKGKKNKRVGRPKKET
jgi:hypothetical protein